MTNEWDDYRASTARAWLESVRRSQLRAQMLQAEARSRREMADGVRSVALDGMPRSPNSYGDAVPDSVIRLQCIVSRISSEIADCVAAVQDASDALCAMDDPNEERCLRLRYLRAMDWPDVRDAIGLSYDGVMKLHRRALLSAYSIMPNESRDPLPPAA